MNETFFMERNEWRGKDQSSWGGKKGLEVQTSSYKINKSWDVMYVMVTVVNNTGLYIRKSLRE